MDTRFKNIVWQLPVAADGGIKTWEAVNVAVLMDIRDELKRLNYLLNCHNFVEFPRTLREIAKNTEKRKQKVRHNPSVRKT